MIRSFALVFVTATGLVLAQQAPTGGWRRVGDPPPPSPLPVPSAQSPGSYQGDPAEPVDRSDAPDDQQPPAYAQQQPQYGPQQPGPYGPQQQPPYGPQQAPVYGSQQTPPYAPPPRSAPAPQGNRPAYGVPAGVTVAPGTFVTVRINEPLSTDHNQPGDPFSGTLIQPLVVDGIVVAQRGQMVYGRVAEAQRQHSDTPSRLGIELTSLTLADGSQAPVRTQLVGRQGGQTPAGVQAGTIAGTTAAGAAIGAAADWGRGAAIGGVIGAAAGIIGVMVTRNHATVIYPETALTFRIETPVDVETGRAPQAFRYVDPHEYDRPMQVAQRPPTMVRPGPPAYYGPGWYPYAYPYGYYPYGGVSIWVGGGRYYGPYRRWR